VGYNRVLRKIRIAVCPHSPPKPAFPAYAIMEPAYLHPTNPNNGSPLTPVRCVPIAEISACVQRARQAQTHWQALSLRQRSHYLHRFSQEVARSAERIADCLCQTQGKSQFDAYGEIFTVLELCQYVRRVAGQILRARGAFPLSGLYRSHRLVYEPYGVVGVIAPWNYPFNLSLQPMLAALIAGNSVLLKPSEHTPHIGAEIAKLFAQAGFPADVVTVLQGDGAVGQGLIAAGIDKLVFTGSVAVGRQVARLAGEHLLPLTLELGGKDVAIVLATADLQRAAQGIAWSANVNAGQACLAVEQVFVESAVADEFLHALHQTYANLRVGDSTDPAADITAITTPAQLAKIQALVADAVQCGARLVCGGQIVHSAGRFFQPTILTAVPESARIWQEEIFGPVVVVQTVADATEAIARTNASPFGLTASVWTRNRAHGRAIAAQLQVGDVAINEHGAPAGHAEIAWGGRKASGFGKTRGKEGLLEMVVQKHISWDWWDRPREAHWFPNAKRSAKFLQRVIGWLFGR
jgi:acyl-CoA reductase-like NAD-dependent aldehyde dehydrogenase